MKENLHDYIRQDEVLRKLLLAQDGGILKYWAEHPDADFDGTLFEEYEKEMVQEYLRANKRNRALASLSEDELKQKARDSYCYEKGSEIHFYTIIKPTLDKLSTEVSAQAFEYVKDYLIDAFKESRRALYPEGIPPRELYKEVIGAYDPTFGLAGRCLWRVLKEHWGTTEAEKDEFVLQAEFDIKLYSCYYYARTETLRQAVKDMIDKNTENKTDEDCRDVCRRMAINAMREVKRFAHLVNGNYWTETHGVRITAEDKRWLRFDMNYRDPSDNTNDSEGMTPMQECFQRFYHILENIGRFWAAQLLQRGIDMKELEKDLGGIFVHDNDVMHYLYYVDRLPDDQYGDCCVFDMKEAKALIESLHNKDLQTIETEETDNMDIGRSALDMISANNIEPYYEGWRNGKKGAISQEKGIYRFIEQKRGKSGMLDRVHYKTEDNPIVAIGIVAFWLIFKQDKDPILQRLTKYNFVPESMLEMFEIYTKERYDEFRKMNRDNPYSLDWDWEFEFYTKYIIPHEIAFNKQSEALFDYISDSDIVLVHAVMNKYIKYLKKIRTEKGFQVNPELLVLRAIDSGDETKQEDLEEFEVNTILENLERKGCIKVCWILGHKPWTIALLDRGRAYLKQLEEGGAGVETISIVETKPVVTIQQPPKEHKAEIPPQTPKMPLAHKKSSHIHLIEDEEWDDTFDYIFNEKVKPQEIMRALVGIVRPKKISEVRFYYVSCRILEILNYLTEDALRTDFMRWINIHFKCGWPDDKEHKRRFSFALEGSSKNLENQHPSQWDENTIKGGSGIYHHQLAIKIKNAFTQTIINGEAIDDSNSFDHLIDRGQYLRFATHLRDNDYYIPEEAYINNGK